MNIFFTVITVCYNSEQTIEKTIKSVLEQSYIDYEYLIIDGASVDGTIDIVKKYEPAFGGRMKWVSEKDAGIYNAMNKGIVWAKGDVISIINSDDWLEKDTLQIVAEQMQRGLDKIYCGYLNFYQKDYEKYQTLGTNNCKFKKAIAKYQMGIHHPATFVPASIYKTVGLFDERIKLFADCDFFIRCYIQKIGFEFVDKILANMLDGGASNIVSTQMINDKKYIFKKYSTSIFKYYFLVLKLWIHLLIRSILPNFILNIYRKIC